MPSQDSLFPDVIGQDLAVSLLSALLRRQHYPSFIFTGPKGVGKRTLALRYAQAVNCRDHPGEGCRVCKECSQIAKALHPDVRLVMPLAPETQSADKTTQGKDAQRVIEETIARAPEFALGQLRPESEARWQISVSAIHWLRQEMAYAPFRARRRVGIILDADQMNQIAANAFLKTLEEPQALSSFILVTERHMRLLETIRSRCQIVRFRVIDAKTLADYLQKTRLIQPEQARIAAEVAQGSLRRALMFLDAPDEFLLPEAVTWFSRARSSLADCRQLAERADKLRLEQFIESLVLLHSWALRARVGLPVEYVRQYPAVFAAHAHHSPKFHERCLDILLRARQEYEANVNRRLFLFALLTSLAAQKST